MVQLIARHSLVYAGKRIPMGGTFDASERDALILCAVKRAERVVTEEPTEPPKRKRGRPRKVQLETPQAPEPQPEEPGRVSGTLHAKKKRKGTYKRRDLRAE
jgi:hypothetical protein